MRTTTLLVACLLSVATNARAEEPEWTAKVVDAGSGGALLHMERPQERGRTGRLFLVDMAIDEVSTAQYWDAYAGLESWVRDHPAATDAELQKAAAKTRGTNWKKIEGELYSLGYRFPGKCAPVERVDATGDGAVVSRFSHAALSQPLTQRCPTDGKPQKCELFVEKEGRRVVLLGGHDLASICVTPNGKRLIAISRAASFDPSLMVPNSYSTKPISGVFVFDPRETVPGPEAKFAPGEIYSGSDSNPMHRAAVVGARLRAAPSLSGRVLAAPGYTEPLWRVRPLDRVDDLARSQTEFVPVSLMWEGAWMDGWLQGRYLQKRQQEVEEWDRLTLEGGITDGRFRVVLRNPTGKPIAIPKSEPLVRAVTNDKPDLGSGRSFESQTLAAGQANVLADCEVTWYGSSYEGCDQTLMNKPATPTTATVVSLLQFWDRTFWLASPKQTLSLPLPGIKGPK